MFRLSKIWIWILVTITLGMIFPGVVKTIASMIVDLVVIAAVCVLGYLFIRFCLNMLTAAADIFICIFFGF